MRARARAGAARGARVVVRLATFLAALVLDAPLVAALLAAAFAARLGAGPVELPWLRPVIEAVARKAGHPLTVGRAIVTWGGLRLGPSAPVSLTLDDIRLLGPNAPASIRHATGTVTVAGLLRGDLIPLTLAVDGPHFRVGRTAAGRIEVAGSLIPLLPHKRLSDARGTPTLPRALSALHVHDIVIDGRDAVTGLGARVAGAVDIDRDPAGLLNGHAHADLTAGDKTATLDATIAAAADGSSSTVDVKLSPFDPASYADLLPSLAPLSAFDAPLTLAATVTLGPELSFARAQVEVEAGTGLLRVGLGTAPIVSAKIGLDVTSDRAATTALALVTAPRPDGPRTTFSGHVAAARTGTGFSATAALDVDRVAFADLGAIWPEGTGGPGTRPWITENVTAGFADHVHVEADVTAPADLSDVALIRIDGGLDAHDVTAWWLRPVPPMVDGALHLSIQQPDEIDIAVAHARQDGTAVRLDGGTIRLTGIAGDDQFAAIETPIRGPVPDVIRILNNPRVGLLKKAKVSLADTAGTLDGRVVVAHLPLRDNVSFDDLGISTDARLRDLRIGELIGGHDLEHGQITLHATADGTTLAGTAEVAHIPARAKIDLDYRAGPPSQVQESGRIEATVDAARLRALGIDAGGLLTGRVAVTADAQARRDGQATIVAHADLTDAGLTAAPLRWRKPVGAPLTASAVVGFDKAGLHSIERVRAQGSGVDVDGSADIAHGRPSVLRLHRVRLGAAVDLAGTVGLPTAPGGGYAIDLAGPSLDFTGVREALATKPAQKSDGPPTPITARVRIGRVWLGDGRAVLDLAAQVERDAAGLRALDVTGRTAGPKPGPFRVVVRPTPHGRAITAEVADLGAVLAGLGITAAIGGGRLSIVGQPSWDAAGRPSSVGTVTLDAFRLRDAPLVARLLKALTLYGIVDLLRGPGVGVTRLSVPFRLTGDVLTATGARAVSPSLGVTAEGQIDLGRAALALRGTVVPAYIINTLPGRLPLIGRLFAPEQGGGVIAATFRLSGRLSDPNVTVNPLSLLTPGALRDVFRGTTAPTLPPSTTR